MRSAHTVSSTLPNSCQQASSLSHCQQPLPVPTKVVYSASLINAHSTLIRSYVAWLSSNTLHYPSPLVRSCSAKRRPHS